MKKIDVLENELYGCIYTIPRLKNYDKIWSKISSDKEILKEAITITRDKFDENDTVVAPTICYSILFDYEQVDKEIYIVIEILQELLWMEHLMVETHSYL